MHIYKNKKCHVAYTAGSKAILIKTGPVRNAQQTKQCMYNIPCDCGRCYFGETNSLLEVRINEHKYDLTQGRIGKSKLAQHAY
jgi:hypothetical protein